ncbi:MAG: fumarylacetoacetate hydrolase family protein [Burkholderiales bacterium]|jgi:fumarylpyruvate hydrolase|nr:fumarylacetoacetate hydrolase family protein [Burkholderiales bacterium]
MSLVIAAPAPITIPVAGGGSFPVRRIYCVGRNYEEHAKEMGFTGREPPFFFMKPADAIVNVAEGTIGEIPYPAGTSNLHYEIELVAAIGIGGANIKAADAMKHVWGYAVGLDMTRRDLQGVAKKEGRPWEIGKAFDQSAPIGPIVPAAAAGNPGNAAITLSVNGQMKQSSSTSKLIWSIAESIEHLTTYWRLEPGDLIFTGTPEGVGAVVSGDLMEGAVAGVGSLKVKVR